MRIIATSRPTTRPTTRKARRHVGAACAGLVAATCLVTCAPAWAWDAATTHAGMTERALAGSTFHAAIAHRMGRALGAFEPLKLHANHLDADTLRSLNGRLEMLDSAGGYRPSFSNADSTLTALGWVKAGAVLAKTPPERGRNHFLEPGTRAGLDDGPGLSGTAHALRLTLGSGATVRDAATGQAFDLEGMPATEWLEAPQNDLGLQTFWNNWQLAIAGTEPSERETALVRALLAMGGVLSVLEDMGQPAFVRNDFRGEFHDDGSEFEAFVANRYGVVALPRAAAAVARPSLDSYFVAADGKGLAQATQQRFFSGGTLPHDFRCVPGDTPAEAAKLVDQSLAFAEPKLEVLDLAASGDTRYLVRDGVRIAAYRRLGDEIHFFFDAVVYADAAKAWLPQVMGYAAGLADHLMRGKLQIAVSEGKARVSLSGLEGMADADASLHVFSEDEAGLRREIAVVRVSAGPATVELPRGARKLAAYVRGRDSAGTFVATGELTP